jgi:hypothetical protein
MSRSDVRPILSRLLLKLSVQLRHAWRLGTPVLAGDHRGMTAGPQKITFAEMREMGVRGLLVYCAD